MPESYIELVKFSAEGIDEITAQTESLEDSIKSAYARQLAMANLLKDPAYRQAARAVEELAEANRTSLKPAVVELTKLEKERQALTQRGAALRSGAYRKEVAERESLNRAERMLSRAERKDELQTLHGGRVGGALYAAERARPAMLGIGAVGGAALAMGRSGMGGTVNQASFEMELKLINREIANALVPALREVTSGLRWVRRNLEKIGPRGQQLLAGGAIAAGVVGTAAVGAAGIGHLLSGLRSAGILGRAGAGAAGSVAAQVAAQAAGTAAGTAAAGTVAGGAAGGAAAAGASRGLTAGRLASGVAKALPVVGAIASLYEGATGGYYTQKRKEGNNVAVSAMAAIGGGFMDTLSTPLEWFGGESYGTAYRKKHGINLGEKSQALIDSAGFSDFDSIYRDAQTAVSKMDAQNASTVGQVAGATPSPTTVGPMTHAGFAEDNLGTGVAGLASSLGPKLDELIRLQTQMVNNNPRQLE